jgi:NTE family protein
VGSFLSIDRTCYHNGMSGMDITSGRKTVGLALSGGAARGLGHIGVLEVLENHGIPIDLIAGTSAGAIIGAAYAWDRDLERITRDALEAHWKNLRPVLDPTFPTTGFFRGRKLRNLLATYVGGDTCFDDLEIPFACVATDIETGEAVILRSGSVPEALRATVSMPGLFRVHYHEDRYLVDGGLTVPIPVDLAREMGADFVIAVNVNPDVASRRGAAAQKRLAAGKEPTIWQVISQSVYISTYALSQTNLERADVAIEPDMGEFNLTDFNRVPEIIEAGRQATEAAIPDIVRKLAE